MNRAKGRRSKKKQPNYQKQFERTRQNKLKRILKSQGKKALDIYKTKVPPRKGA